MGHAIDPRSQKHHASAKIFIWDDMLLSLDSTAVHYVTNERAEGISEVI